MTTPNQILAENMESRYDNLDAKPQDTLFIKILKSIFRTEIWNYPHAKFLCLFLRIKGQLDCDSNLAQYRVHNAIEWYYFLVTMILGFIYIASYLNFVYLLNIFWLWLIVTILVCLLAIYRLMEILATFAMLHLKSSYHSKSPVHALVLTFVSYINIIIVFAILFIVIGDVFGDTFSSTSSNFLCKDLINPIYFSFVTITTLGYGDLSPQTWAGKLLVIAQILIGILTIVVIVQRVIAVTKGDTKNGITK